MPKKGKLSRRGGKKEGAEDHKVEDADATNEDYFYDEIDKFHSEREKILLEEDSDAEDEYTSDEEEVLGIGSDESDNEEEDKDHDQYEESAQAWGRKKSSFYGTDAIENLEGSDREEAEREEEEEVLAIQRRLAQQIDEDDFGLDMLQTPKDTEEEPTTLKKDIEADFSSLSRKAQWKLVKKQSPELQGLIDDFKEKVAELESELTPLMQMIRRGDIPQGYGSDLISLKFRVYLAYTMNISFYLMLKTNRTAVQNHPVISRLVQYKTVINRVAPLSKKLQPEIKKLLSDYSQNPTGKQTNSESLFDDDGDLRQEPVEQSEAKTKKKRNKRTADEAAISGKASTDVKESQGLVDDEFSKSMNEKLMHEEDGARLEKMSDDEEKDDERRAINYEIAKNKGMKQKRRKIDRNPRVKMREKFRKAKIRRRGQVREYRPELKKYSGEPSGIRIGLKKSVTLN